VKDKDFYGGGEHPEAGAELVYINGKWHDTYDIYHPKCKSKYSEKVKNETHKKIEKKTLSSVGFSRSRKIEDSKSERSEGTKAFSKGEREQQLDRLVILQNTEARLVKDLERTRSVIKSIKSDLSI